MKFLDRFRRYRVLAFSLSSGAGVWFSSMAGYQITHAYELFELYEVCLLEGEDCFKAQVERMELLTLMWDGSLRFQVLLSFLFFYLAGLLSSKNKSTDES